MTEEEKKNRSERVRGEKNSMYGKPGTWLGKHFSEDHKQHLSESLKGRKRPTATGGDNPAAKKVINLNTGEVFSCIKEASEKSNIGTNSIYYNLNGKTQTCCGCKWESYDEEKTYELLKNNTYRNPKKKVYILELDIVCDTATEAAKIIGCDNSLISKKCKTVTGEEFATAKNYHIRYIN